MMVGLDRECAQLEALITGVRAGGSTALMITGDVGIGKTTLWSTRFLRLMGCGCCGRRGTESQQNPPFAALADLVRPVLGHLDMLPGRQRMALAVGWPAPDHRCTVRAAGGTGLFKIA